MKNLNTIRRLCGSAAIIATTILISSSARVVAQANVQNVQVAGSPSGSASPLANFQAVETPADRLTTPPPTSASGLSALIAITPQNSASPAASASPATAVSPAASGSQALSTVAQPLGSVVEGNSFPAPSASPAPASGGLSALVAAGAQNVFISPAPSPATSVSPAATKVPIQGSQANKATTGITTTTPSKNITIKNSTFNPIQGAQTNSPATGMSATKGPAGDASNGGFNQHPGLKIKNKGHGQLSNAGSAGDDDGRKLHNGGQGAGLHKKQQQMQTQEQGSQSDEQGDSGRGRHRQQKVQSTQPESQQQGGRGGKGKVKPTETPD